MESIEKLQPDFLFEVSWEVCNKVGGIHTVIATKARTLERKFGDQYILIGPDVWKGGNHPEFLEDSSLFKAWKENASHLGLKIRIGRWKILGNPIVVLVDFTTFYTQKNEIFTDLWVKFQLDSITGQWDYIEPALFGYASAKVIECFYSLHLNKTDKIVAQFHEWMTGGGVLYLNDRVPQIGTIFTTHATVLGRAIAGGGVAFYSQFTSIVPDRAALDFNVEAKNSLEKVTARISDCFTTVSEITGRECKKFLGRKPDVITKNGFDVSILPDEQFFEPNRVRARNKVIQVAEGLLNQEIPKDALLVLKSGRYEFKNKGIDVFINSLGLLNKSEDLNKTVVGVIFVPAYQTGPKKEVLERIKQPDFSKPLTHEYLTHYLHGAENDAILLEIEKVKLFNLVSDKVKIIFVPTYLDGNDGIFNFHYYELLIGFDLAVFPSYYEPWGYTPLESIAYHIPAITTDVSGFGAAIRDEFPDEPAGISVISRRDNNEPEVTAAIYNVILGFTKKSDKEVSEARTSAREVSLHFLWENLIKYYYDAYEIALSKVPGREELFHNKQQLEPLITFDQTSITSTKPVWRSVLVEAELPKGLSALNKLMQNLWWTWDYEAREMLASINRTLWEQCGGNPSLLLRQLSFSKIEELNKNKGFLETLSSVEERFDKYMATPLTETPLIAYFCMEYGLCNFLKLYSGGLGILAGDYLKEASDACVNMVGVGLLYKNGYFSQKFSVNGEQIAEADVQDFTSLPLELMTNPDHTPMTINLFLPGRTVTVQIWKLCVGRICLYLMDTNIPQNSDEDKRITAFLYDGTPDMRLKQELLLGVGGIRTLKKLGIKPDVYHCNEGHASFISLERIGDLIKENNLSFDEAIEITKSTTLFTTHTSVPAANDIFSEELLRKYIADNIRNFNIDWSKFMGLGRANSKNHSEQFSMTYFGSKMSQEINAVSRIHRGVSCKLLSPIWENFKPEELHISYVTNGVHYNSWTAHQWQQLCSPDDSSKGFDDAWKLKVNTIPDKEIWNVKQQLKKKLVEGIKKKLDNSFHLVNNPSRAINLMNSINENAIFIGFARRFVAYKRSGLLFKSMERLSKIINNESRPVLFLFAGKAHPADLESIKLITNVINNSANPMLHNSLIFLEDYSIDVSKQLVQGVDVWLNFPERYMEASGTSGMKAALNGVLNFSVMDGWWAEAYNGKNGWMMSQDPTYKDHELQNQLDAEIIYNTLENEIIPLYFDRNSENVPVRWIEKVKASLVSIVPMFNTNRMLMEYNNKFYKKQNDRLNKLKANNYAIAKNLANWKKHLLPFWDEIEVVSIDCPLTEHMHGWLGKEIRTVVVLNIGQLSKQDVGVEIILTGERLHDHIFRQEFNIINHKGREVTYECIVRMEQTGAFDFSFRIFAKNENLAHRQDFDLIKWI